MRRSRGCGRRRQVPGRGGRAGRPPHPARWRSRQHCGNPENRGSRAAGQQARDPGRRREPVPSVWPAVRSGIQACWSRVTGCGSRACPEQGEGTLNLTCSPRRCKLALGLKAVRAEGTEAHPIATPTKSLPRCRPGSGSRARWKCCERNAAAVVIMGNAAEFPAPFAPPPFSVSLRPAVHTAPAGSTG